MNFPKISMLHFSLAALLGASIDSVAAQTVEYLHTDAQGTLVAVSNSSGMVIERREYEPYGQQLTPVVRNGPGYTGHVQDAATGLTYMQQRYYDPLVGRFLSVDPVDVSPLNGTNFARYWYADNNPYTNLDPDGRATCSNADCSKSTIDTYPARTGQPPTVNGDVGLDLAQPMTQDLLAGNEVGPIITFKNDVGGGNVSAEVTTETAKMVESAVISSGAQSVNINSTTGGTHAPTSRHPQGRAVDINRIDGQRVDNPVSSEPARKLQESFARQDNIRENFGPARNEKTQSPGATPVNVPSVAEAHRNHIHVSGQR
jgi:RHS repeat-associated protein